MGLTKKNVVDARDLIKDRENWGVGFANFNGHYCLGGALAKAVTGTPTDMYAAKFIPYLQDFIGYAELSPVKNDDPFWGGDASLPTIYRFNDYHTHEEVLALLDKVIERMSNGN